MFEINNNKIFIAEMLWLLSIHYYQIITKYFENKMADLVGWWDTLSNYFQDGEVNEIIYKKYKV